MSGEDEHKARLKRIAEARAALAARYAANPAAADHFETRMRALATAKKRERERFETKVLGETPVQVVAPKKPAGMSKAEWKIEKKRLTEAARIASSLAEKYRGKQGTPETLEHFAKAHAGALAQLHANGSIDSDQLAWSQEISATAEQIHADVAIGTASLEARVDRQRGTGLLIESLSQARRFIAYGIWRSQIPTPKQAVLDMIVGDAMGYTLVAKIYRIHNRRAKRLLIEAIDRWPACMDAAVRSIDRETLNELHARLAA